MKSIYILFFGLIYFGNTLNAQESRVVKTYTNKNYAINYFEPWELNTTGQNRTEFFLYTPLTTEGDEFKENINLLIQDQTGRNTNLDEYVAGTENQISTVVVNGKLIESKRLKGEKYPYHKIIFSGSQGSINLKFLQYYWIINEQAYILTFSAELDQFDNYINDAEVIFKSFTIN